MTFFKLVELGNKDDRKGPDKLATMKISEVVITIKNNYFL